MNLLQAAETGNFAEVNKLIKALPKDGGVAAVNQEVNFLRLNFHPSCCTSMLNWRFIFFKKKLKTKKMNYNLSCTVNMPCFYKALCF
jgi:hypothetical protein